MPTLARDARLVVMGSHTSMHGFAHLGRRVDPVLITDAEGSRRAEHRYRARRYTATMGVRLACLVLAVFVRGSVLMWVAIAGAVVLPWVAVIMANDRLPRRHRHVAWHDGVVSPDNGLPPPGTESGRTVATDAAGPEFPAGGADRIEDA